MIRKLKVRMILLVLIGLLLASAGLVAAINQMNWNSLSRQANEVLDMLAENNGQRPSFQFRSGINNYRNSGRASETPPAEPDRTALPNTTPSPEEGTLPPWMQKLAMVNPMYHLINFMRTILIDRMVPAPGQFLACIICGVLMMLLGTVVFHKTEEKFILYL